MTIASLGLIATKSPSVPCSWGQNNPLVPSRITHPAAWGRGYSCGKPEDELGMLQSCWWERKQPCRTPWVLRRVLKGSVPPALSSFSTLQGDALLSPLPAQGAQPRLLCHLLTKGCWLHGLKTPSTRCASLHPSSPLWQPPGLVQ